MQSTRIKRKIIITMDQEVHLKKMTIEVTSRENTAGNYLNCLPYQYVRIMKFPISVQVDAEMDVKPMALPVT